MSIFRTQNRVPEVYPNMSRDFQLLCRAFDIIQNGVKYDIDNITDVLDTDICDNSLLALLQLKIGFYSDKLIPDDDLRIILKAFPHIKFYKGSIIGIKRALNTYLKIRPTKLDSIVVTNKVKTVSGKVKKVYMVDIVFSEQAYDLYILDEILKFILSPSYTVRYSYVRYVDTSETTNIDFKDVIVISKLTENRWTSVADNTDDNARRYNNALIRNIQGIDYDTGNRFANEILYLSESGIIDRNRSAVNIGAINHVDYNKVNLEGDS